MRTYDFYKKGIEKLFSIINKDMEVVPFKLNDPQNRVLKDLSRMDIILKARQEGISSLILAIFTLDFISTQNIRCVVISHEQKATQRLFDKVKYYLFSMEKNWPGELPYKLKYNSRSELVNTENNATFYVGTAGARAFGHGETINNLHVSELSRWPDQETMMVGLLQAVPKDGRVIVETTANGRGDYFYNLWIKNENNDGAFKVHFLPWFELKDYQLPATNLECENGHPTYGDELDIMNKFHLNREQMSWRRWKIDQLNGNMDMFNEQFPSTAEEAFIVSGNPVWSPTLMKYYMHHTEPYKRRGYLIGYNPLTLDENEKGPLKVWRMPHEFHNYTIGVDVSEGKMMSEGKERDYSCAQVIDKTTYEQAAVWHGRIDPDILGREVEKLGRFYNNAYIAVERNSIGLTTLVALRDLNYNNIYYREKFGLVAEKVTAELGWVTDMRTKEMLVNETTNLLRDKRIRIYDDMTIGEMMSYVRDASGHANAARSSFDDRCVSFMIAIMMLTKQGSVNSGNQIEQSGSTFLESGGFTMQGVTFNERGMPVSPEDTSFTGDDINF